jgi:hypothetical protein
MSDKLTPQEIEEAIRAALTEVIGLASGVADLQTTDEAAEDILSACDLVAEYFQIERVVAVTEELEDGSGFITRFQTYVGAEQNFLDSLTNKDNNKSKTRKQPIPGSIRTQDRPNLRVIDCGPKHDPNDPKK